MEWEVLESEYLFKRPWLTARREHVKLPTGAEIKEFYVLEYPEFCNVIAITKDGKFVMEQQYRHAQHFTGIEIPAGCVEPGEDPLDAAKRELYEETGYAGGEWSKLMTVSPNAGACTIAILIWRWAWNPCLHNILKTPKTSTSCCWSVMKWSGC